MSDTETLKANANRKGSAGSGRPSARETLTARNLSACQKLVAVDQVSHCTEEGQLSRESVFQDQVSWVCH